MGALMFRLMLALAASAIAGGMDFAPETIPDQVRPMVIFPADDSIMSSVDLVSGPGFFAAIGVFRGMADPNRVNFYRTSVVQKNLTTAERQPFLPREIGSGLSPAVVTNLTAAASQERMPAGSVGRSDALANQAHAAVMSPGGGRPRPLGDDAVSRDGDSRKAVRPAGQLMLRKVPGGNRTAALGVLQHLAWFPEAWSPGRAWKIEAQRVQAMGVEHLPNMSHLTVGLRPCVIAPGSHAPLGGVKHGKNLNNAHSIMSKPTQDVMKNDQVRLSGDEAREIAYLFKARKLRKLEKLLKALGVIREDDEYELREIARQITWE